MNNRSRNRVSSFRPRLRRNVFAYATSLIERGIRVLHTYDARLFYSGGTFYRSNKRLTRFLLVGRSRFHAGHWQLSVQDKLSRPTRDKRFNAVVSGINAARLNDRTCLGNGQTSIWNERSKLFERFQFYRTRDLKEVRYIPWFTYVHL